VAVSTPAVGKPQPPTSVQAALSSEAFTPYAALGQSNNDGLAPNESNYALSHECMTAAGYPDGNTPFFVSLGLANLAFSEPYGAWGYLSIVDAEQYGFRPQPGAALSDLGIDGLGAGANQGTPSAAEQAAMGKCTTIVADFGQAEQKGPLAGISTLSSDIYNDVGDDGAVKAATRDWAACMAKNGYSFTDPGTAFQQEFRSIVGTSGNAKVNAASASSNASSQAQIAAAVTDADCTQSTDLAGIYFAVQASYEQQLVNANQQALGAAVQQYRSDYASEVSKLPALLRTAKANPYPHPKVNVDPGSTAS
jgi:hypothetical protein